LITALSSLSASCERKISHRPVVLSAEQEGDHILLCISDDGAGMDPVKLRAVAVEKVCLMKILLHAYPIMKRSFF